MFGCPDVKMTFSFAVINRIAPIVLETINNARADFFGRTALKKKLAENVSSRFKKEFLFVKWSQIKKFTKSQINLVDAF